MEASVLIFEEEKQHGNEMIEKKEEKKTKLNNLMWFWNSFSQSIIVSSPHI